MDRYRTRRSNHLSIDQGVRSAIHDSQQPTSPTGFLLWNFRHCLVRYYWYATILRVYIYICILYRMILGKSSNIMIHQCHVCSLGTCQCHHQNWRPKDGWRSEQVCKHVENTEFSGCSTICKDSEPYPDGFARWDGCTSNAPWDSGLSPMK